MSSGIAEIVTGPITGQQNLDSPELPAFRPAPAFHGSPLCYSLKRCPTAAKNQCRLAVEANIKTPRTLETQQQFDLITTLKPFAGQRFTISVSADEDSLNLVEVIRGILQA